MEIAYLIFTLIACFIVWRVMSKFKHPKTGNLVVITGGVKAGKTTYGVSDALTKYRRAVRSWRLRKFFSFGFDKSEKPLLYSNIPLKCEYVPFTLDLLLRKKRFVYGSVIYISEASLLASSMDFRDTELNEILLLFNKLIGHETKGGYLVYDTQCIQDVHYSVKRSISDYLYVHHIIKWLPFFLVAYVREDRYSEDGTVVSTYSEDVEKTLQRVLIPKSIWKKFDCYCYSAMTDDLPVERSIVDGSQLESLKISEVVSVHNIKKESAPSNSPLAEFMARHNRSQL